MPWQALLRALTGRVADVWPHVGLRFEPEAARSLSITDEKMLGDLASIRLVTASMGEYVECASLRRVASSSWE